LELPNIINVQKYSIHDGDGIRTTFFFKGCLLSCRWCHNPESQNFNKQLMFYREKCTGCSACVAVCPHKSISIRDGVALTDRSKCTCCGVCTEYCVNNAREVAGEQYTVNQLVLLAEKDKMFYETSHGGITLSGGEVMMQNSDFICELLNKLKRKGYNIAIDTCGYAPYSNFEKILPYVDTFLYDIKLMDSKRHELYMGRDNVLILDNLKKISDAGACINIRIPVIEGVNSNDEDMEAIISYLKDNINVYKVNLLPYHNTGKDKYERLNMKYLGEDFKKPSDQRMNAFVEKFKSAGFHNINIGG